MERTCDDVQLLADTAKAFGFDWFQGRPAKFRVIGGDVGCGKTHVSKRLAIWARRAAYDRWSTKRQGDELPRIEYHSAKILGPKTCKVEVFEEHLQEMRAASMVILDDIGTEIDEFKDGTPAHRLCQILNQLEGRYLWVTTNKEPKSWATTWDKRVEDRLLSGEVVFIGAPSFRSEV